VRAYRFGDFELNLRNLLDGDVFTDRCGEVTPGVAICSSGTKRHRRRLAKVAALEGKSAKAG